MNKEEILEKYDNRCVRCDNLLIHTQISWDGMYEINDYRVDGLCNKCYAEIKKKQYDNLLSPQPNKGE